MAEGFTLSLPQLHEGQQEVFDSKARFRVVCCGRRWGKTHLGVLICILVAAKGGRAWWIGPDFPRASIGWRLLREMVAPIPGVVVREGERMIIFPNGGVVHIKSATDPDSLRGESLDFVVFDEVADIKSDAWFLSIRPALADRQGGALFIGTPRGQANWFFDLFERARLDTTGRWAAFQQPTQRNTMIPDIVGEIEDMTKDMHVIEIAQEIDAEFVVSGGSVFRPEWQKWYQMSGDQHVFDPDSSLVLMDEGHIYETCPLSKCLRFGTSDLALSVKQRADYTVIAAWALTPGKRLCILDYFRDRIEAPFIVPELQRMREKWRLSYMGIEKVAFQASIVQEARRRGMPVKELVPDRDKDGRAYNAGAHMEGGRLWWRKTVNAMDVFATEVINYPLAPHDDCTDVTSYATTHIDRAAVGPQMVSW